ncbi:methyltransferase domain-containing protein [Nocardiopsis rhodophaea]|uniref:methyltransferase domain-containing protein n=1 Tax=Nocardiopsis rhodophaea TaxID=280238 RepID=UPI0031DF8C78
MIDDPPGPDDLATVAGTDWALALRAAPRHLFTPDRAWTSKHGLIDRAADADTWWEAVNSNIPVVTQIDDGTTDLTDESPWMTTNHSSSCSAPSMVFDFLRLLAPQPGDRVLEIGTGTGWTAALLSARLGAQNITTIEVDDEIAGQAVENLKRAGVEPHVVVGDGARGWPHGAPYDGVHVTCGVADLPHAWVQQTRPGGVIVFPWMHGALGGGHKTALTATGDTAVGRFHGECAYMMLRGQRDPHRQIEGEVRTSEPGLDPRRIASADRGLSLWLAGALPGVSVSSGNHMPDGAFRMVAWDRGGDSHARVDYWAEDRRSEVAQRGQRDLWNEVEAAYMRWVGAGAPEAGRFGLIVDSGGQRVWVDRPGFVVEGA